MSRPPADYAKERLDDVTPGERILIAQLVAARQERGWSQTEANAVWGYADQLLGKCEAFHRRVSTRLLTDWAQSLGCVVGVVPMGTIVAPWLDEAVARHLPGMARAVKRARALFLASQGKRVHEIAKEIRIPKQTISRWLRHHLKRVDAEKE